ncbi:hypothetical protein ACIQZG_02395 [Lysinibacillus sp. NPDC096418]|uniref:hypothetical protein n=1 Tax=Lysinibacillus sp. NPDC096418 TaxID=3364138 RepID=UPI00382FECB7
MKAYSVTECVSWEKCTLVFAETANEAKTRALCDENMDGVAYTDLRVNRAKYADGHENDSERDLMILNIRNGWWYEIDGEHIDSNNIDEAIANGWI